MDAQDAPIADSGMVTEAGPSGARPANEARVKTCARFADAMLASSLNQAERGDAA